MKKKLTLCSLLVGSALLAACSEETLKDASPDSEVALIQIVHNGVGEIDAMALHVTQAGQLRSTQETINADGSAFEHGDIISFDVTEEDINFEQPITIQPVITVDGNEETFDAQTLELAKGDARHFEITGSAFQSLK